MILNLPLPPLRVDIILYFFRYFFVIFSLNFDLSNIVPVGAFKFSISIAPCLTGAQPSYNEAAKAYGKGPRGPTFLIKTVWPSEIAHDRIYHEKKTYLGHFPQKQCLLSKISIFWLQNIFPKIYLPTLRVQL